MIKDGDPRLLRMSVAVAKIQSKITKNKILFFFFYISSKLQISADLSTVCTLFLKACMYSIAGSDAKVQFFKSRIFT